jgi:hypothetical protein
LNPNPTPISPHSISNSACVWTPAPLPPLG